MPNDNFVNAFRNGQYDWFLALVIVLVVTTAWFLFVFLPRMSKKSAEVTKKNAASFSAEEWRVQDCGVFWGDDGKLESIVLKIQSLDFKHVTLLTFRPAHPDVGRLQDLQKYDFVGFAVLEECLPCALETEICGYLRLV